jgi:hypothetical protein
MLDTRSWMLNARCSVCDAKVHSVVIDNTAISEKSDTLPSALCLPYAPCPMPYALCPMRYALGAFAAFTLDER